MLIFTLLVQSDAAARKNFHENFVLPMQDSPESDPYNKALFRYESKRLIVRNRLQYLLESLNPRDYLDWSGSDTDIHKRFFETEESSSSHYEALKAQRNSTTNKLTFFDVMFKKNETDDGFDVNFV